MSINEIGGGKSWKVKSCCVNEISEGIGIKYISAIGAIDEPYNSP